MTPILRHWADTWKRIWFLAPTVELCKQQHDYIRSHLPAVMTRLLIGSDNVDRWSEQRIWNYALDNIRIVVSTYAVLADALGHGFVKISTLALLVIDEGNSTASTHHLEQLLIRTAHRCIKGDPGNKIMQLFYNPSKEIDGPTSVPHILGLSASPVLKSSLKQLEYAIFLIRCKLIHSVLLNQTWTPFV
jgi:ERCC4-related helicase